MSASADLDQLLEDAPDDPEAARELANLVKATLLRPDQRVGTALRITRRGGEPGWRSAARAKRDCALKEMARQQFGDGTLGSEQARALLRRIKRQLASAQSAAGRNNDLLDRIEESGLALPGLKQFLRIINGF